MVCHVKHFHVRINFYLVRDFVKNVIEFSCMNYLCEDKTLLNMYADE